MKCNFRIVDRAFFSSELILLALLIAPAVHTSAAVAADQAADSPVPAIKADPDDATAARKKPVAEAVPPETLAAQAKQVFRTRCFECHGGKATQEGIKVLDRALLVENKKVVVPGEPDKSILYQRISADDESQMPPPGQPRPSAEEIATVRRWIAAGAPNFPNDVLVPASPAQDPALRQVVGVDYVLNKILAYNRGLRQNARKYQRYFSTNHLLMAGATRQELDQQRDALVKVINHLSWEPEIVPLKCIDDPVGTVFCVDIRDLGWDKQPYVEYPGAANQHASSLNLFDLALLEYPYGAIYEDSDTYDRVMGEYVYPAQLVRPIPYVRADWFTSTATLFPLYEDFLQLPFTLDDLDKLLDVRPDYAHDQPPSDAQRAGMTVSGVSRNNRVVQRQRGKYGAFWRSFDFAGSKGTGNMFKDPINLHPNGGEMIFNLPNGLQGYFVTNGLGKRLEAAPTEIVTDKFAEDKTVRDGLSCMRCHDQGIKGFRDTIRQAVEELPPSAGINKRDVRQFYPEQKQMDRFVDHDAQRFVTALTSALGHAQQQEPITPVTRQFLDAPLQITTAAAELGYGDTSELSSFFKMNVSLGLVPLASGGVVRRDTWEDYYDQVVRGLATAVPIVPLDGLHRSDYPTGNPPFDVSLSTSKPIYSPGDEMTITVASHYEKPLYIELIGTSADGKQVILTKPGLTLSHNSQYHFPEQGAIKVTPSVGKEHITLFASDQALPPGKLLRGQYSTDRVVHDFYPLYSRSAPGKSGQPRFDPSRLVKKTIEIETK
jgi:mono/diheme cytochrome c family protein